MERLKSICIWKKCIEDDVVRNVGKFDYTEAPCYRCLKCDGDNLDCEFYISRVKIEEVKDNDRKKN